MLSFKGDVIAKHEFTVKALRCGLFCEREPAYLNEWNGGFRNSETHPTLACPAPREEWWTNGR